MVHAGLPCTRLGAHLRHAPRLRGPGRSEWAALAAEAPGPELGNVGLGALPRRCAHLGHPRGRAFHPLPDSLAHAQSAATSASSHEAGSWASIGDLAPLLAEFGACDAARTRRCSRGADPARAAFDRQHDPMCHGVCHLRIARGVRRLLGFTALGLHDVPAVRNRAEALREQRQQHAPVRGVVDPAMGPRRGQRTRRRTRGGPNAPAQVRRYQRLVLRCGCHGAWAEQLKGVDHRKLFPQCYTRRGCIGGSRGA
mmetsp:Transcript_146293/g.469254  ORF Transcript_146293/g.469254 Transcript_146293/m.469254 type:complete len:254 (-) Transcript_146293:1218-1979(-)